MMKTKLYLYVACFLFLPLSLGAQSISEDNASNESEKKKEMEILTGVNVSSGIGWMKIPGDIFSAQTSMTQMQVDLFKWNGLTIGLYGSMIGMDLKNYDFSLSQRQQSLIQILIGPKISYEYISKSVKGFGASYSFAFGYTRLFPDKKGANFTGILENLNKGQNGIGAVLDFQLKKTITSGFYLVAGYSIQSGSLKVGGSDTPHKLSYINGAPHIGLGFVF